MQTRHAAPMRGFCIIERGVIHNAGAHERFRASHNPGDLLTDNDLKTERATEPPKRWRNWYRARYASVLFNGRGEKRSVAAGQKYPGQYVWPSKEIAEQKSSECCGVAASGREYHKGFYLGAFPDGETP